MLSLNGEINDVVFGVSGIGLLMESVLIVDLYTVKREGGAIYPLSSFEKNLFRSEIGNDRDAYAFVRALFKKNL